MKLFWRWVERLVVNHLPEPNRSRFQEQIEMLCCIPWWVFALIVVPPMAWTGYEWYAHWGLTRWLGERQLELLGAWYPGLTFLVVGTIFGSVVGAVVTPVMRHWMKQKRVKGFDAEMPSAVDSIKNADAAKFVPVLAGVTIAAAFMIPGAYFWISAARMGPLIHVDVVALEKGQAPTGGYVELAGSTDIDRAVVIYDGPWFPKESEKRRNTFAYVPVVAPGSPPQKPVAAFVKIEQEKRNVLARQGARVRGTLARSGLGGTENVFAANGVIVAHPHWVVEQGTSPEKTRTIGMTFVFNAIPLGLGVWFLVRWLTRRRRSGLSER
jgi:hypothetical protein